MKYKRIIISKFGGPDVLKVVEEDQLPEPQPNEVRVKVMATSAAFTDTLVRKGIYPGVKKKPPFSPGYDMVGVIDKVGERVTQWSVGQQVAALTVIGAYTEYMCLEESKLVRVPDGLDPVKAVSLVLSYVTAYQMLHRKANIKEGQSILIHGAGGAVGTALIQLGKLKNLKMFGTASKSKHVLLEKEGIIPIDYKNEDFVKRIKAETKEGVDAAFDAIGGDHFKRSLRCLKKGGTLVAYGFYNAGTGKDGSIPIDFIKVILWNILPNGRRSAFYAIKQDKPFSDDLTILFNLLSKGQINPVIDRVMPLKDAAKAHELIDKAEVKGKIVLIN